MVVPANPGSVMEFNWGDLGEETYVFVFSPCCSLCLTRLFLRFYSDHVTLVRL